MASKRRSNLQKCMGGNKAWHCGSWGTAALPRQATAGQTFKSAWAATRHGIMSCGVQSLCYSQQVQARSKVHGNAWHPLDEGSVHAPQPWEATEGPPLFG
eukprot:1153084-Pelagomonas_calceolata.AAC.5